MKTPVIARVRLDVGLVLAREFARIDAELEALPDRTSKDNHAALCQALEAVIRAQLIAGHPEPLFLVSSLANLTESSPENPYRHTHKEFGIQSEETGDGNPTAATERAKRFLPIAVISLLMKHGNSAVQASCVVATAIDGDAKKLLVARDNASRKGKKTDLDAMHRRAGKHVQALLIKHRRQGLKEADALAATVEDVAKRVRSWAL